MRIVDTTEMHYTRHTLTITYSIKTPNTFTISFFLNLDNIRTSQDSNHTGLVKDGLMDGYMESLRSVSSFNPLLDFYCPIMVKKSSGLMTTISRPYQLPLLLCPAIVFSLYLSSGALQTE